MIRRTNVHQSGFTLIEIIITIVFVALLGAVMITFLSKSLVDSSEPVKRLRQTSDLNNVMANIIADYNKYPKWRSATSYTGGAVVVPTIRNGHFYTTSGGGTSGAVEPAQWPVVSAATLSDGGVTWTENGMLESLTTLQGRIGPQNSSQNNAYGTYYVVQNTFIQFPVGSDAETAGGDRILKVMIANNQGETLTALFLKGQNE